MKTSTLMMLSCLLVMTYCMTSVWGFKVLLTERETPAAGEEPAAGSDKITVTNDDPNGKEPTEEEVKAALTKARDNLNEVLQSDDVDVAPVKRAVRNKRGGSATVTWGKRR